MQRMESKESLYLFTLFMLNILAYKAGSPISFINCVIIEAILLM